MSPCRREVASQFSKSEAQVQAEPKWAACAFITCRTSTQLSHLNLPQAGAEPIGVAPAGLHRRPALTRRPTGLLLARLSRLRRADPGPSRRALCHAGYGTATSCGRPFHWVAPGLRRALRKVENPRRRLPGLLPPAPPPLLRHKWRANGGERANPIYPTGVRRPPLAAAASPANA